MAAAARVNAQLMDVDAMTTASMTVPAAPAAPTASALDRLAHVALLAFVASVQISIAAAGILLTLTFLLLGRGAGSRPRAAVGAAGVRAAGRLRRGDAGVGGLLDRPGGQHRRQQAAGALRAGAGGLHLARGRRAATVVDVVIAVGAASAAYGIIQYAMLHYDNLGQRPQGALTHYMTYSGVLMLVVCAALARVVFGTRERGWPALVMPALVVALSLTLGRSAWVGTSAAVALLLGLKDFRLTAFLPLVVAALLRAGARHRDQPHDVDVRPAGSVATATAWRCCKHRRRRWWRADPLTGVGPNMVPRAYPTYRDAGAVEAVNPHLHNVPMQIAAERGLPALAIWLGSSRSWRARSTGCSGAPPAPTACCPPPGSPPSPRCWPPGCSSTTSATRSS